PTPPIASARTPTALTSGSGAVPAETPPRSTFTFTGFDSSAVAIFANPYSRITALNTPTVIAVHPSTDAFFTINPPFVCWWCSTRDVWPAGRSPALGLLDRLVHLLQVVRLDVELAVRAAVDRDVDEHDGPADRFAALVLLLERERPVLPAV